MFTKSISAVYNRILDKYEWRAHPLVILNNIHIKEIIILNQIVIFVTYVVNKKTRMFLYFLAMKTYVEICLKYYFFEQYFNFILTYHYQK